MKKSLCLIFACLAISACKESVIGTLAVTQPMSFTDLSGQSQTIQPGNYVNSSVTFYDKKAPLFEVVLSEQAGLKTWFNLSLPIELQGDRTDGHFSLSPAQTGQPFGVDITAKVNSYSSAPYTRGISCVYDTYTTRECNFENVCRNVPVRVCQPSRGCHTENRRECRTEHICRTVVHNVYGTRYEERQDTTTSQDILAQFIDGQDAIASFHTVRGVRTQTYTLNSGPCTR